MNMKRTLPIVIALLCGCQVAPPATKLSIPTKYGMANLASPRDSSLEGLKVDLSTGTLALDKYSASNNPAVVTATGDAQAQMMAAWSQMLAQMMQLGMTLMNTQREMNRSMEDLNRERSDMQRMRGMYPIPMGPPPTPTNAVPIK